MSEKNLQSQFEKKSRTKDLKLEKLKPSLEVALNSLFRHVFITNCHIDEASVTNEELETLDELTSEEILENFKDLVTELLEFKREYKTTDKAELATRSEQFENMLQKLEAEIRNHIRIEHQLKLHIETNQNRLDELEKFKNEAEIKILDLEEKLTENKKNDNKDKKNDECLKLKTLLEEKVLECKKLKKDLERAKSPKKVEKNSDSIKYLKKILEDKVFELNKIQKILKDKNETPFVKLDKNSRKSMEDNCRSSHSPFQIRKETENTLTEFKPSTAKKSVTRSHLRSNSDQTRQVMTKKFKV